MSKLPVLIERRLFAADSDDLPELVRFIAGGFAVVETWHVFNLRCGDIQLAVRRPTQRVRPKQTFVRDNLLDALACRIPTHDCAVFKIGKINTAIRAFEHAITG